MEVVSHSGRRVAGFGVGGLVDDLATARDWWNQGVRHYVLNQPVVTSSSNPAFQATAAITGQKISAGTPPDAPPDPAALQKACASIPDWMHAVAGCSNVNVTPAAGTSLPTAPASVETLLTGGGVDANGKPIKPPVVSLLDGIEWIRKYKVPLAIGGVVLTGAIVYGAVRR